MSRLCLVLPLLILQACRKDEPERQPEAPKISYSREIRPLLISNCLQCHADLPLHNPSHWDLLHPHPDQQVPALLREWVEAGSEIDQHWALSPIQKVSVATLDDFPEIGGNALSDPRTTPPAFFTGTVEETLAGDHLSNPDSAIATGYFRQNQDTPASRALKTAHQFLGLRIECAQCHDHPHEPVSTNDYLRLVELFTTPYDSELLPVGLRPPLHIPMDAETHGQYDALQTRLTSLLNPPPVLDLKGYQEWLSNEGNLPQITGLISSYNFENSQLTNLAPNSPVTGEGFGLITENGAHGRGILFDDKSHLSLQNHGIINETAPFAISLWIKLTPEALAETSLARIGTPDRGFELKIIDSKVQLRWSRAWPQNAIAATSTIPLIAPNRWCHLVVASDGSRRAEGLQLFFNGLAVDQDLSTGTLIKPVLSSEQPMTFQGAGAMLDELQVFSESLIPIEAAQLFDGKSLTTAFSNKEDLSAFYTHKTALQNKTKRIEISAIKQLLLSLERRLPEYPVLAHQPVTISKGEEDTPSFFTSLNRLDFARRLNRNLLARAMANEVWRAHFGTPLVNDLGYGSEMPPHPDLLEWLAGKLVEFRYDPNQLAALIQDSILWLREMPDYEDSRIECPRTPDESPGQ